MKAAAERQLPASTSAAGARASLSHTALGWLDQLIKPLSQLLLHRRREAPRVLHTWTLLLVQATLLVMSDMGILLSCAGTRLSGPAPSDRR